MKATHTAAHVLVTLTCALIAAGCGNDLATVAGAVGGAIVGHEIQQRAQERNADRNDYRIVVRMRAGSRRTFTDSKAGNLHVGQDVSIVGDRIQM
jgi:outer membrane lipoprotein SlyB